MGPSSPPSDAWLQSAWRLDTTPFHWVSPVVKKATKRKAKRPLGEFSDSDEAASDDDTADSDENGSAAAVSDEDSDATMDEGDNDDIALAYDENVEPAYDEAVESPKTAVANAPLSKRSRPNPALS